jgi:hypothetical protein
MILTAGTETTARDLPVAPRLYIGIHMEKEAALGPPFQTPSRKVRCLDRAAVAFRDSATFRPVARLPFAHV